MVPQGREVIIGSKMDRQFRQTLIFGLGGVFVEVLKDVSLRLAPIEESDAREMIHEIKGHSVLNGFRGQSPADEEAMVNILLKTSDLVMENQEIGEMDLNPVMVYEKGASIVDARIVLLR
jgi:acyl-CoA synthetase (NDP forming)